MENNYAIIEWLNKKYRFRYKCFERGEINEGRYSSKLC